MILSDRDTGHKTTDPIVRAFIRLRDEDRCKYCQRVYNPGLARLFFWRYFDVIEIDHVIPVSLGGRNHVDNYVLSCRMCNRRKGTNVYTRT